MGIGAGLSAFKLAFEISPIILQNGIAQNIPGGMLPIVAITEALNFVDGLLSGGDALALDDFFAHFVPMPGSTLVENQFGHFPFANQSVAANARIKQPLVISLRMICPVKDDFGYAVKLATMTALKAVLDTHDATGGTYIVATPSCLYPACLLARVFDVSRSDDKQAQHAYQWDFEAPLLALNDALAASMGGLLGQITSGIPIVGPAAASWSGLAPTVGVPSTLGSVGVVGSTAGLPGAVTSMPLAPIPGTPGG